MVNREVTITLLPGNDVVLTSDNPNIEELVRTIVSLQDTIDVERIEVSCESEGFDTNSFAEVIKESCQQLLEDIQLEKKAYEKAMAALTDSSSTSE